MNSAIFQRVRELFHVVCELPPSERSAYLDSACGDAAVRREVDALLDADSGDQGLLTVAAAPLAERLIRRARIELPPEPMPEQIGAYRILERLGGGGMGEVFAAEQERPRRKVAIKLMRRGMIGNSALRRFALEAEVLGRLQHENIARIFEAGLDRAAGGERPFLVMEFVDGLPLTRHAEARQLGLRERVALFARVCDGVQHAHQRGVIHRDLKPANILVGVENLPKILDFGIARTLDDSSNLTLEHSPNAIIGTLAYMSPEQVSGDRDAIDTRTDVYSLGVVLFELLTGIVPHDISGLPIAQAARVIAEGPPPKIDPARRDLRGDLETIILKALQRERNRRYGSPAEMAADLRHYLAGEPIVARADSALYVLSRQLSKHRTAAALGTGGLLVLIGSVVALAVSYSRQSMLLADARAARDAESVARATAETQATKAETISAFVQKMLTAVDAEATGRSDVTVREILDDAMRTIDGGSLAEEPDVEASVRTMLGSAYRSLGLVAPAEQQFLRAADLAVHLHGDISYEHATILHELAGLYVTMSRFAESESLSRRSMEIIRATRGEENTQYAMAINGVAEALRQQARLDEAAALFRQALAILERVGPADIREHAFTMVSLGSVLDASRDFDGAESMYRGALEIFTRMQGRESADAAQTLNRLGIVQLHRGDHAAAEPLLRESLSLFRRILPADHPRLAEATQNLGVVLQESNPEEAEALYRAALESYRSRFGPDSRQVSGSLQNLGVLLRKRGRFDEALECYTDALRITRVIFEPDHPRIAVTLMAMANLHLARDAFAEAEPLAREAYEIRRKRLPENHPDRLNTMCTYGQILLRLGRADEAEPLAQACLAQRIEHLGPDDASIPTAKAQLGATLFELGRFAEAEPLLRDALSALRSSPSVPAARRRELMTSLSRAYAALGRPEEAARWREASAETQPAE